MRFHRRKLKFPDSDSASARDKSIISKKDTKVDNAIKLKSVNTLRNFDPDVTTSLELLRLRSVHKSDKQQKISYRSKQLSKRSVCSKASDRALDVDIEANDIVDEQELMTDLMKLESRPSRDGLWFIVHQETLESKMINFSDKVDIVKEFFSLHPNYNPILEGFVAIQLSYDMMIENGDDIRIASYHHVGNKGMGQDGKSFVIPSNYVWFLKHIKKNQQIGWLDFVAHIGVNASKESVFDYMGELYSSYRVLTEYTSDIDKLSSAMNRAWIFSEIVYSEIDPVSIRQLFKRMRKLGENLRVTREEYASSISKYEDVEKYIRACTVLSNFIGKRGGCLSLGVYNFRFENFASYVGVLSDCSFTFVMDQIIKYHDDMHSDFDFFYPAYLFSEVNDEKYDTEKEKLIKLLTVSENQPEDEDDFFSMHSLSILKAAMNCKIHSERDRSVALTGIAKQVLELIPEREREVWDAQRIIYESWVTVKESMENEECALIVFDNIKADMRPRRDNPGLYGLDLSGGMLKQFQGSIFTYKTQQNEEVKINLRAELGYMGIDSDTLIHSHSSLKVNLYFCMSLTLDEIFAVIATRVTEGNAEVEKPNIVAFVLGLQQDFGEATWTRQGVKDQPRHEVRFYKTRSVEWISS